MVQVSSLQIFSEMTKTFDFGFEDDDEDFFIDDEEMMAFLNEYYLIFEDRLPDAEYR